MTKFEKRKLIKETISILRKKGMIKETNEYSDDIQLTFKISDGFELKKTARNINSFLINHGYESLLYQTIPNIIINTSGDLTRLKKLLDNLLQLKAIESIMIDVEKINENKLVGGVVDKSTIQSLVKKI